MGAAALLTWAGNMLAAIAPGCWPDETTMLIYVARCCETLASLTPAEWSAPVDPTGPHAGEKAATLLHIFWSRAVHLTTARADASHCVGHTDSSLPDDSQSACRMRIGV